MSDKILDEGTRHVRFKKPVTLTVNKKSWTELCDDLHKKSTMGTFIMLAIFAVASFFTFALVLFAAIGLGVYINVGARRKFAHLKTLADHSYIISSTQITDIYEGKKQIIPFDKIKNIEYHTWGIELDTKKSRKMSDKNPNEGKVFIPREVNDFGRVMVTIESLEAGLK